MTAIAEHRSADPVRLSARFEGSYRVRFDESGPDGALLPGGFLRYGQDLAWQHSETAGFDRAWYDDRGLHWLVRAVELREDAAVPSGAMLDVTTRVTGWRRVWARRETTFELAEGGGPVALMLTDWVLVDDRGRPVRVPDDIIGTVAATTFEPIRLAPIGLDGDTPNTRRVAASEVDPMGIVNNAAWMDHVADAAWGHLGRPRTWRLEILRPSGLCDEVVSTRHASTRGVTVLITDPARQPLVRAELCVDRPGGETAP